MPDWAGETGVEHLPRFINPYAARALGVILLPSVTLNPDRGPEWQRDSEVDMLDHNGRRMTLWPETLLYHKLDEEMPEDAGKISVSRIRYMGMDVDSGWHEDTSDDYRFSVSLLGEGDFYYKTEEGIEVINFKPGDAIKLDNTAKTPHKAVSRSQHRVVLVYGRQAQESKISTLG